MYIKVVRRKCRILSKEADYMSEQGDGRCNDCGGRDGLHFSDCVGEGSGGSGGSRGGSSTLVAVIGLILGLVLETLLLSLFGVDPSDCPGIILLILWAVFSGISIAVVDSIVN